MSKLVWVLLPLAAYALYVAVSAWRGRAPSRVALNVQTSLLLLVYLLTTAGLGVFWVANQQLPVFDWHYLFGYGTLLLVSVHLLFNLPQVLRGLRRASPPATGNVRRARTTLARALAIVAALGLAFFLGVRHGASELAVRWDGGASTAGPVDAVVRYHAFSSESRRRQFERAPGVDWGAPPPAFKRYPAAPHRPLARDGGRERSLDEALRAPAERRTPLTLAELGELLYLSAGVTARRGGLALRAAPSSGALFPSELYLIVRRVDGLPAGLYHYDAERHRLAALGAPPQDVGTPGLEDADAVVVLTAVFRRTGYKYRDRAYRYAVADAGHLLENLRLAGHRAGMAVTFAGRFDEARSAAALGVDGVEEGVLAVAALHPATGAAPRPAAPPRGWFAAPPSPAGSAVGVTGMAHLATSLRWTPDDVGDGDIVLPAPVPAAAGVADTLVKRRSQRRFLDRPVPLAALSSLLADVAQPPQLSDALRLYLVVNRVAGLGSGVYRYRPGHALQRVRDGDFAAAARSAALSQDVIGEAAVVLLLSAERGALLAEGARGYRHGYLEAGMLGQRWLLGAVARGLAACPVGGFYDDEAAALIGVDGRREWVLHFAALGWPAS
ncbi:SagB-type dehydrogenase family enzyme [Crenobacter luteus]|uniref:SagB/ThcOx family dehydrogenase n=1 Tax=Crenobacter luteus TaxID=1452487 RepID=UPI00104FC94C|nr:SagB family peptide dehydrogenase [Crenobacter luteus]TCP09399.1 SagB-type dehydrogenase family enzyme [Crenobacter luteus]